MKAYASKAMAVGLGAIALVHCGVDHPWSTDEAHATSITTARVTELRTSFGLPASSVERFDVIDARVVAVIRDRHRVARAARVGLPMRGNGDVEIEDETSRTAVRFALEGTHDSKMTAASGMAVYVGALGGADVVHRVHPEGTEDFVAFEKRPTREELRYSVDVSRVAGLRLVSRTLEFVDGSGTPVLRVAPPYVIDSSGVRHAAELTVSGCAVDTSPVAP